MVESSPEASRTERRPAHRTASGSPRVVERNIKALVKKQQEKEGELSLPERCAAAASRFIGSLKCAYLQAALLAAWIVVNLGWTPWKPFDPSLGILTMIVSVEALFFSLLVLINQNRMAALEDQRADLSLQISLLSEHELTRLLQLSAKMARRLGVAEAESGEIEELTNDVHPEEVLEQLERHAAEKRKG